MGMIIAMLLAFLLLSANTPLWAGVPTVFVLGWWSLEYEDNKKLRTAIYTFQDFIKALTNTMEKDNANKEQTKTV